MRELSFGCDNQAHCPAGENRSCRLHFGWPSKHPGIQLSGTPSLNTVGLSEIWLCFAFGAPSGHPGGPTVGDMGCRLHGRPLSGMWAVVCTGRSGRSSRRSRRTRGFGGGRGAARAQEEQQDEARRSGRRTKSTNVKLQRENQPFAIAFDFWKRWVGWGEMG